MRLVLIAYCASACAADAPPPSPTARQIFDRSVTPILAQSCGSNTSGCHAGASPISFHLDSSAGYPTVVSYAGNFDTTAPLLHAHDNLPTLSPEALDVIAEWFAAERFERGL